MAAPAEVTYKPSQPESATTLRTIVELVRRITHADVTSVVSFSPSDETITWQAASGFRVHVIDEDHPLVRPVTNKIGQRALQTDSLIILEGIGVRDEFPASDFSVHAAEGIRDLALAPLKAKGQTLGALFAGYRSPHHFTDDEKQLLQDLAEMAALALDNARLVETVSAGEERLRVIVEASPSAMVMVNEQGRINLVNAQTEQLFGYPRAELLGHPVEKLVPERYGAVHPEHRSSFVQ